MKPDNEAMHIVRSAEYHGLLRTRLKSAWPDAVFSISVTRWRCFTQGQLDSVRHCCIDLLCLSTSSTLALDRPELDCCSVLRSSPEYHGFRIVRLESIHQTMVLVRSSRVTIEDRV